MHKTKQQIQQYHSNFYQEELFKEKMLLLLKNKKNRSFLRSCKEAHFTASAWLIDQYSHRVLLLKHTKLNKWLQPGGHADGETDLELVARKEAEEETNLRDLTLASTGIFDLDIHTIPKASDVQEHLHYDVRYAFWTSDAHNTKINKESKQFLWLPVREVKSLTCNPSILRMLDKTLALIP